MPNLKPKTVNPKPLTLNSDAPKLYTRGNDNMNNQLGAGGKGAAFGPRRPSQIQVKPLNPKPYTLYPKLQTLNLKH